MNCVKCSVVLLLLEVKEYFPRNRTTVRVGIAVRACGSDKLGNACRILTTETERKKPLRKRSENRIILKHILKYGLNSFGSGLGPTSGFCEYENEPSVSMKGGSF
jgi:hypothetical protein